MSTITANEIKKHGVHALNDIVGTEGEAIITVRGKKRYVVLPLETYHRLREADLAQAVREVRAEYRAGRIADDDIHAHMDRLDDEI